MMFRSILSPVDFSEHSRHALRWAGAFAARFQSRLTVIGVVDPLLAEAARVRLGHDLARAETEPALHEFIASTRSGGDGAPVETVVKTFVGNAADAILEAATAEGADLIVMGTQGLGGLRKWLLGSTTERLLRRTHIPVLAVPFADDSPDAGRNEGPDLSHILAATDFSQSSVAAATLASNLARQWSATLTIAHVVEPLMVPAQWQPLAEESDETRLESARARLESLAGQLGRDHRGDEIVVAGRPAETIGAIARDRDAHLIVMGLNNDRGLFAPRPGSIAYRVLSATTVPVLVVPAPDK